MRMWLIFPDHSLESACMSTTMMWPWGGKKSWRNIISHKYSDIFIQLSDWRRMCVGVSFYEKRTFCVFRCCHVSERSCRRQNLRIGRSACSSHEQAIEKGRYFCLRGSCYWTMRCVTIKKVLSSSYWKISGCSLGVFPAPAFVADFPPVAPEFHQRTHRDRKSVV